MRTALQHLARDSDVRKRRIVALLFPTAARVFGNAARLWRIGLVLRRVPVHRPLPDIADHVVEAVAVRREGANRRGALVTVRVQVLPWKFTLPGIGHVRAAGREFVAPGKLGAVEAAPRSELPLGFGRQIL